MLDVLSHEDAARLHMETRDNPMTIVALVRLDGALPLARLEAIVERSLAKRARFRERVVESVFGRARWEHDPRFDLRAHVHRVALPAPGDEDALAELVSDLASTPLDPRMPLWQMHLVEGAPGGSAIVARVHHAVADGLALVELLLDMSDEGVGEWRPPHVAPPRMPKPLAAIAPLGGLAKLALSRPEPETALSADPVPHKSLAWTRSFDLGDLRSASKPGAGVTALLLAVAAGAVRRVLVPREPHDPSLSLRALVPISIRAEGEGHALGNRYASVFVSLPIGVDAIGARIEVMGQRLRRATFAGLPVARRFVGVAGWGGARLERAGVERMSRRASLVVSNVPGPRDARHFDGVSVRNVIAFAPVPGRIGLGITFLGYAGRVSAGVASGLAAGPDARDVAAAIEAELEALSPYV